MEIYITYTLGWADLPNILSNFRKGGTVIACTFFRIFKVGSYLCSYLKSLIYSLDNMN